MADNYTETSFVVRGTQKHLEALKLKLDEASEDEELCLSMEYHEYGEDAYASPENRFSLGIYSGGDSFDDYQLAELIQNWMVSVNRIIPVQFSVSYSCSKARVDEFGGEAYVITQSQILRASEVFYNYLIANGVIE